MDGHGKQEPPNITLRVKESKVSTPGSVRINNSTLEKLQMKEEEKLDVYFVEKKKTLVTYADELIGEGDISIRKEDMDYLVVGDGENVVVSPHEPFTERLRETVEESTEKLKQKLEGFRRDDKDDAPSGFGAGAGDEEGETKPSIIDRLKGLFRKKHE